MGMTQTKTYRNPDTGYWVTLTDSGHRVAAVTDSLGYRFPMIGADYPHAAVLAASRAHNNGAVEVPAAPAPVPMVSPLAPAAQVRSTRPLVAETIGLPTLPQARCLTWATGAGDRSRAIHRGRASVIGMTAPLDVLIAMSRRGWVMLDHPTMPMSATVRPAGRSALNAYVAKHGPVL